MTVMHDLRTFPGLLAHERERVGLSKSQLAAECGFDHSYLSRLEQGQREPSRETVAVLADRLGLNREDRCRLFVAARYVPDGDWVVVGDWLVRPVALNKEKYA